MIPLLPDTIGRITRVEWDTLNNRIILLIENEEVMPVGGHRLCVSQEIDPAIKLIEAATGFEFVNDGANKWQRTEKAISPK